MKRFNNLKDAAEMYECIEIYKNIDDFCKMQLEYLTNNTFSLLCDVQQMNLLCDKIKHELQKNNIEDYVIIRDLDDEQYYLIEKRSNFKTNRMYQFEFDFDYVENNRLYEINDDTIKLNIAMYYLYEICHYSTIDDCQKSQL